MKRSEIEQLLPEVMRRTITPGGPLQALLEVMETLHAPAEEVLDQLDRYFDPYRTPAAFVPYLASWLDLERIFARAPEILNAEVADALFPSGLGRLRALTARAVFLSQWRGTAQGMIGFLETATGVAGFAIDEQIVDADRRPRPFHIQVRAPVAAEPYAALIGRIIEQEKPAYVTYELVFQPAGG
jgi:phage tail-like protein